MKGELLGILTGCVIVGGIIVVLCKTFDIITFITFPKRIIIKELQAVYFK